MAVRALVLRTAGTNCDHETAHAFELAGAEAQRIHVNALLDSRQRLGEFDILAVPGGFAHGDDLGAGTLLANKLGSHLRDALESFLADGRQVIGICNGFQVLVRLGILPGAAHGFAEKSVSLVENDSGLFEDRWVNLRVDTDRSSLLEKDEILSLPVAHKEGKLVVRDPEVLAALKENGQIALSYVPLDGEAGEARYPDNPNGSTEAIAGLTSPCGRVLGLMPHPERHLRALHHPAWTRRRLDAGSLDGDDWRQGDGYRLFERAVAKVRR